MESTQNEISVIICTYNSERYLKETLDSLIPFTNFIAEIIFVDGQSSDSTVTILKAHEINNIFNVIFISSPPSGVSQAMNIGASHAKGEYLAFLNSDDFWNWTPLIESELKNVLSSSNYDLVLFSCIYLYDRYRVSHMVELSKNMFFGLFLNNRIYHPSTLIQKSFFIKMGGFCDFYPTAFDYDFWIRSSKSAKMLVSQIGLATFRVHTDSLSFKYRKGAIFEILRIRIKNSDNVSFIFISYLLFFRDTTLYVLFDFKALWHRLKRLWLKLFT